MSLALNLIISILLLLSLDAYALENDKKEKVYIAADSSIYNYKTGINLYQGNVKIDQGTTHITADRLVTKNNHAHKINEAIAYGDKHTAHYWTLPKVGDLPAHAYAKVIKFYPINANVVLEKNVLLTQGKNSFQGQVIFYNMNEQTITVPASKNGRAVLVYNPDK